MRDLLSELLARSERDLPTAYCRLVETRGSTPQKAGAAMLVFPDGSQRGTLGGGCVEAEVKRRALARLADGQAEIARFSLDSDYGWDDGLICGGRMEVLVEPVLTASAADYFRHLAARIDQGAACTEAIVFDREKSGWPAPSKLLFDDTGRLLTTTWCGALSPAVLESIRSAMDPVAERPRPTTLRGVAYLPYLERCRLVIVGGGHVGQAVGAWAVDLDFDVWVIDDRQEFVSTERFPRASRRLSGNLSELLAGLEITCDTYCLIVTRGHHHDEEALYHLADRGARYVGMIGSRRKIKLILGDLADRGVSPAALSQVFAPVGIDIGSQTVSEIAVSILAELVAHRNRQGEVPGRPLAVSLEDVG